jgi:hypothetical protein
VTKIPRVGLELAIPVHALDSVNSVNASWPSFHGYFDESRCTKEFLVMPKVLKLCSVNAVVVLVTVLLCFITVHS